jgi:hypothetical protein
MWSESRKQEWHAWRVQSVKIKMDLHSSKTYYIAINNSELNSNLPNVLQLWLQTSICNLRPNMPRQLKLPLCKRCIMHFYIFPLGYSILRWKAFELKEILTKYLNNKVKMLLKVIPNLWLHVIQDKKCLFIFHRSHGCQSRNLSQFQKL